ncbi:MAG: TonB-dependent receptor domain-containing protein, partial [Gammaproteobacteria bacterium]
SFSETNLNIVTRSGPTEAGFNEFTPLFERNKAQLNATGVFGNHDTVGGEGVVSAVYDRFSLSAGAFHHETDGWRDNHGIDHDIYNVFAQAAITPELNIQAEYRNRDSEFGDLEFDFLPGDFDPNFRNTIDQETARAGLRYSPAQHSTFLLSYIHGDRTQGQQNPPNTPEEPSGVAELKDDAHQVESQYIFKHDRFNVIAGFGYTRVETGFTVDSADAFSEFLLTLSQGTDDYRGYVYTNINFPHAMTWTLGLSVVDFAQSGKTTTILNIPDLDLRLDETNPLKRDISKINPKVGLQWDVTRDLRLRVAYIEAVKQSLVANRTLEPTQVAGFNQFFDEADGSKSRRYGAGLDWQLTPQLAVGGEATWRDIDDPILDPSVSPPVFVEDEADERLHQVYLYWTPLASLALRAGFSYDAYQKESDELSLRFFSEQPLEVETISVPVSASYFHPSGFFAGASVSFVDQDVEKLPLDSVGAANLSQGGDQFAVVDAAIGFRLPKRWGILSLQVHNLFDEGFNYQDDSFREFSNEPTVGPYFPDRSVLGRITINF